MKKKKFRLFSNPFNSEKAHFGYEVVESGEVEKVKYEEDGEVYTYPRKKHLIKALGGRWSNDYFYCTSSFKDALKELREGEIISANLHFSVVKDHDGNYQQRVSITDIYTLNDYYQIREAEAVYQSRLKRDEQETA